jgi:predicted metal-dependent peptidase
VTEETTNPLEEVPDQQKAPQQLHIRTMTEQERLRLAFGLQKFHTVFNTFWEMASVAFSRDLPTAAVYGTPNGRIVGMRINPDFWDSLSFTQQLWVICHECLHVILNHFVRGALLENHNLANKMMDVVINQSTIEKFGFKRSEIDPDNRYCWYDKFFYPEDNVLTGQSFEYYYNEILKHPDRYNLGNLLDDHVEIDENNFSDFIRGMNGRMTAQQKEQLKDWIKSQFPNGLGSDGSGAGDQQGNMLWTFEEIGYIQKKKKWESVIKNWVLKAVGFFPKPKEQWVMKDRRMSLLPKNIFLPHILEEDTLLKKKDKINLFFFLDTSGSCIGFGERFFRAAKSIPTDKFNLFLFNFDTCVYEVDIEKEQVQGGGGTSFDIIEAKIQEIIKRDDLEYPRAVWIITDGDGNVVKPEIPENWHWFMTEYHSKTYVHEKSSIYNLVDYE